MRCLVPLNRARPGFHRPVSTLLPHKPLLKVRSTASCLLSTKSRLLSAGKSKCVAQVDCCGLMDVGLCQVVRSAALLHRLKELGLPSGGTPDSFGVQLMAHAELKSLAPRSIHSAGGAFWNQTCVARHKLGSEKCLTSQP